MSATFKSVQEFLVDKVWSDEAREAAAEARRRNAAARAQGEGGPVDTKPPKADPFKEPAKPAESGSLRAQGWRGKPGRKGKTIFTHPDYPEERIRVDSGGAWVHSDDDGAIAWGTNRRSMMDHLGGDKKSKVAAEWTAEYINALPDSSFAYVEPGGVTIDGRTEPVSLRHCPYKTEKGEADPQALCNALNGIEKSSLPKSARKRITEKLKAAAFDLQKYITHEDGEWQVRAESGKVLGRHDTKEEAQAQLAAVESNKKTKAEDPSPETIAALMSTFNIYAKSRGLVIKAEALTGEPVESTALGVVYKVAWGDTRDSCAHFCEAGGKAIHVPHYMRLSASGYMPVFKAKEGKDDKIEYQKYTLGVVYPAKQVDFHNDTMSDVELEKAAWNFMSKDGVAGRVGLMHKQGTSGAARVVESYIYRGPKWEIKDATGADQVVMPGDWLMGVVWNDEGWDAIKSGEITGYSLQGIARKEEGV